MSQKHNFWSRTIKLLLGPLSLAAKGEKAAANYLHQKGYQIACKNWRNKRGELDLIGIKDTTLAFIEVKTRKEAVSKNFSGLAAVDQAKQTQIKSLAEDYILAYQPTLKRLKIANFRYDVVEVVAGRNLLGWDRFDIKHHPGAFE